MWNPIVSRTSFSELTARSEEVRKEFYDVAMRGVNADDAEGEGDEEYLQMRMRVLQLLLMMVKKGIVTQETTTPSRSRSSVPRSHASWGRSTKAHG